MRKYIGKLRDDGIPEQAVIGVPARDLSEEEWRDCCAQGLIVEGQPTAALWKREKEEAPAPKAHGKDGV